MLYNKQDEQCSFQPWSVLLLGSCHRLESHTHTHTCTHHHSCTYTHTWLYTHTHTHTHMHTPSFMHTHSNTFMHIHTHMAVHTHTHTHTHCCIVHMHTPLYTHTHTLTCIVIGWVCVSWWGKGGGGVLSFHAHLMLILYVIILCDWNYFPKVKKKKKRA